MSNWEQAHILQFWAPATGPGVWTSGMAKRPPKRKKQDLDPWPDDAAKPDPWGELSMNPWDVDGVRHFDPWETAPADTSSSSCSRVSLEVGAKLLASASVKTAFNEYELKGADPVDCKARWNQGCPRKCNLEGCKPRALQLKDLQSLCRCFWGISSHERAQLLQATYSDSRGEKMTYFIGETRVCFPNFCSKLRTSQITIRKLLHGTPDMRQSASGKFSYGGRPRDAVATGKCDVFFQQLHQGAAEPLPEDEHCGVNAEEDPWEDSPPIQCSEINMLKLLNKFLMFELIVGNYSMSDELLVARMIATSSGLTHFQWQPWSGMGCQSSTSATNPSAPCTGSSKLSGLSCRTCRVHSMTVKKCWVRFLAMTLFVTGTMASGASTCA